MKEIGFFTAVLAGTIYLVTSAPTSNGKRMTEAGVICQEDGSECRPMTLVEKMVGREGASR